MDITPEILAEAGEMLKRHLNDYRADIGNAFDNFDEDLTVSLKTKFGVEKGQIRIETGISFPVEKVKDGETAYFDPSQMGLFGSGGEND